MASRMILPYTMHSESIVPSAPSNSATGRSKICPSSANTRPQAQDTQISMEKIRLALCVFPSPIVLAIRAPPPVPNIKPMHPSITRKGMMKFTAANAVLPTKLDTKKAVYHPINGCKHQHHNGRQCKSKKTFIGKMIRKSNICFHNQQ